MFRKTLVVSMLAILSLAFHRSSSAGEPPKSTDRKPPAVKFVPEPTNTSTDFLLGGPSRKTVASYAESLAILGYHLPEYRLEEDLTNVDVGLDRDLPTRVEVEGDFNVECAADGRRRTDRASGAARVGGHYRTLRRRRVRLYSGPNARLTVSAGVGSLAFSWLRRGPRFGRDGERQFRQPRLRRPLRGDQAETAARRRRQRRNRDGRRPLADLDRQTAAPTGFWEAEGSAKEDRAAATGMCLLAIPRRRGDAQDWQEVPRNGREGTELSEVANEAERPVRDFQDDVLSRPRHHGPVRGGRHDGRRPVDRDVPSGVGQRHRGPRQNGSWGYRPGRWETRRSSGGSCRPSRRPGWRASRCRKRHSTTR